MSDVERRIRRLERQAMDLRRRVGEAELGAGYQSQWARLVRQNVGAGVGAGACAAITVTGRVICASPCNSGGAPGVTVTATGPGTTATATTASNGVYSLTLDQAGSWTVAASQVRIVTATTTVSVACGNTYSNVNLAPAAASGYHCYAECGLPLKDTLSLSDSNGTHTGLLTWDATAGAWTGCYSRVGVVGQSGVGCPTALVSTPLGWVLDPAGGLAAHFPVCDAISGQNTGGSCPRPVGGYTPNESFAGHPVTASRTCPPSSAVLTFLGGDAPGGVGANSLLDHATNWVVFE